MISDSLMQALIKEGSPPVLRDYLAVQTFTGFQHPKECVTAFSAARPNVAGNATSSSAPMEVGGIYGNNNKGQGKYGKGKDKGKKGKKGKYGKAQQQHQPKGGGAKFDGWCNSCGKYGHKAADCWGKQRVNEIGQENNPQPAAPSAAAAGTPAQTRQEVGAVYGGSEETGWILVVNGECPESRVGGEILVDSGAHCSVCPRWFAEGGKRVSDAPSDLKLRSATGKLLKTYGVWLVPVRLRARSGEVLDGCICFVSAVVRGPSCRWRV